MSGWQPSLSLQGWGDLVTRHTTDVQSLPSFQNDTFVGDFTPDFTRLLRASTHPDPFSLENVRDQRTGRLLYLREVWGGEKESKDKSVRSFTSRPLAPESDGPQGSATGKSFWPGGFSDSEEEVRLENIVNYWYTVYLVAKLIWRLTISPNIIVTYFT